MAINLLFTDFAISNIPVSIGATQTSIPLTPGTGALFPNPGGSQYFYLTLADFNTNGATVRELVKVTQRVGDVCTVCVRNADGNGAHSFQAGDKAELRFETQAILDIISGAGGGAPTSSTYLLATHDGTLPNNRILAGTAPITIVDGGAGNALTISIAANGVTNALLAQMAGHTFKGNNTAGLANALDLTQAQLTAELNVFVASGVGHLKGLVPDPGAVAGTTKFLREDAIFAVPPGTGAGTTPTYITLNNEAATLPNSRRLITNAELTETDGGVGSTLTLGIAASGVTNAMLATMTTLTVKANVTGGTANPTDVALAVFGPLLPVFGASGGSHSVGQVPDPGGSAGSTRFLREDGTWGIPVGSAGTPLAPNLFRNSGMVVAQRATQTLTTAPLIGSVDSWAVWASTGVVTSGTIAQSTAAPVGQTGYAVSLLYTVTGVAVISFRQRIESRDAIRLKNQTASIQFNVYQDTGSAVNYTIFVRKANAVDNFSATTNISNSGAISVNTATPSTVTYNNVALGDVSNGIEIEIQAAVGAQTAKNLYWTEAEIHQGTNAQQYQYVPFATELDWVHRFYQKSFAYATAPAQNAGLVGATEWQVIAVSNNIQPGTAVFFKTTMRATPSMTGYNPSAANAQARDVSDAIDGSSTSFTDTGDSGTNITYNPTASATARARFALQWSADAEF